MKQQLSTWNPTSSHWVALSPFSEPRQATGWRVGFINMMQVDTKLVIYHDYEQLDSPGLITS